MERDPRRPISIVISTGLASIARSPGLVCGNTFLFIFIFCLLVYFNIETFLLLNTICFKDCFAVWNSRASVSEAFNSSGLELQSQR